MKAVPLISPLQIEFKYLFIDLRQQWAWHSSFEINFIPALYAETFMFNFVSLPYIIAKICAFIQTEEQPDRRKWSNWFA